MKHFVYLLAQTIIDPGNNLDIPRGNNLTDASISSILQIVFAIAGAVALLIIVLAGLSYTTSQGDPQSVAKAKNAIIYASIGLVICMMAYAIVRFIVRGIS